MDVKRPRAHNLTHMTELEARVVELTKRGLSARKVADRLDGQLSVYQVAKIARRLVGRQGTAANSREHSIQPQMMPIVLECLRRRGLNAYHCDICDEWFTRRCQVHHTKYEGATIYDLCFACRSCQLSRVNKGLA